MKSAFPILFTLEKAGDFVRDQLDTALSEVELSTAKLNVLRCLINAGESLPLGMLAHCLGCVKSNVTQLVDRLEEDGFVQRVFDSEDRRCRRAELTEEGRRRYWLGVESESRVLDKISERLSLDEQAQLVKILERLGLGKRDS